MSQFPTVPQVQAFFSQHDLGGIDPEIFLESLKQAIQKNKNPQVNVGDIVLFEANPDDVIAHSNYNKDRIPAIVTRKWSELCVNIKIIPDCGPMQDRTSVVHHSINPAGYNFILPSEKQINGALQIFHNTGLLNISGCDYTKDASSYLKQEDPSKTASHVEAKLKHQ